MHSTPNPFGPRPTSLLTQKTILVLGALFVLHSLPACSFNLSASTKTSGDAKSSGSSGSKSKSSGGLRASSNGSAGAKKSTGNKSAKKSGGKASAGASSGTSAGLVFKTKKRTGGIKPRKKAKDDFKGEKDVLATATSDSQKDDGTIKRTKSGPIQPPVSSGEKQTGSAQSSAQARNEQSGSAQSSAKARRASSSTTSGSAASTSKARSKGSSNNNEENVAPRESQASGSSQVVATQRPKTAPISPPETPPENVFGYDKPVSGCFEGFVYNLKPGTRRLPKRWNDSNAISVVYACEWDIPVRKWSMGFPGIADHIEWFAIQYRGGFHVDLGGTWKFRISSDDGAKLYIDGKLILDNDGVHSPKEKTARVKLRPGDHKMVLEYFQGPRYHINLQLFATPPGGREGIFSVR